MSDITNAVESVKQLAQQLTESSRVLVPVDDAFPVAQFAVNYVTEMAPTNTEVTEEMTASVEDHFEKDNAELPVVQEEENLGQVNQVATALGKIQYVVDNIICPSIKSMVTLFGERQAASTVADIRADVFKYNPIHSEPGLTQHIQNYRNAPNLSEYQTYILPSRNVEQIIEMVSINNPHVEREVVTEWLLGVDAETIQLVYDFLFSRNSMFTLAEVPWLALGEAPFSIDALLLAYFLCGHLIENIIDPVSESATEEEWNRTLRIMHEMFGNYLMRAYLQRAENQQNGVLVLRSESARAIERRRLVVVLNGDVAPQWRAAGGDVSVVLGFALDENGTATIAKLAERADYYLQKFNTIYPLINAAAHDNATVTRRNDMLEAFLEVTAAAEFSVGEDVDRRQRAFDTMAKLSPDQQVNEYMVFARMLCDIYFPNSTYLTYMSLMDDYSQQFPNATRRELATESILTLAAVWLAAQVQVQTYAPIIAAPTYTEQTEEPSLAETETEVSDAVVGEGPLSEEVQEEEEPIEPV